MCITIIPKNNIIQKGHIIIIPRILNYLLFRYHDCHDVPLLSALLLSFTSDNWEKKSDLILKYIHVVIKFQAKFNYVNHD